MESELSESEQTIQVEKQDTWTAHVWSFLATQQQQAIHLTQERPGAGKYKALAEVTPWTCTELGMTSEAIGREVVDLMLSHDQCNIRLKKGHLLYN